MAGADVGAEVDELLAELSARGGEAAGETGERLVSLLVDFYGAGLARIAELVGPETLLALSADPLVESQLILHGLHPLTADERIELALDRVRPYLGSHAGGVGYLGVDADGVARLRLAGSCTGCASSAVTVRTTIEQAVLAAAPEVVSVDVEGMVDADQPKLLQIGRRPGTESAAPARWLHPAAPDLPAEGSTAAVPLDGRTVFMARLAGTLYAYEDRCPRCGAGLAGGRLDATTLTCAGCGARFDLRLAGRPVDATGDQLQPLPLLDDASGVRVALPAELAR